MLKRFGGLVPYVFVAKILRISFALGLIWYFGVEGGGSPEKKVFFMTFAFGVLVYDFLIFKRWR